MSGEKAEVKVVDQSQKLKEDIMKAVKDFVLDSAGKIDLNNVQVALMTIKDVHNHTIDAATKRLSDQKIS
jgi:hypothetical protein